MKARNWLNRLVYSRRARRTRLWLAMHLRALLTLPQLYALSGMRPIAGGATNEVLKPGWRMPVVVSSPATPASGDPVRFGKMTGVAMLDEGDGGAGATETVVDFGPGVYDLLVDDNESGGIAVGDPIYFHDTPTGSPTSQLNNTATAMDAFFGTAMEVVSGNATTIIRVMHIPLGATLTQGSLSISAGMLESDAVTTAKIIDAAVTAAKLSTALQGSADGLGLIRAARFTFDPTTDAAMRSQAGHGLGVTLPDNALVLGGMIEILTTFTSANDSGTIALSIQGANDLVTATAISSGTFWDAVKSKVVVPDALNAAGVATAIKLTAAREVTATVGTQDLTGGKLVGWLFYVIGD